MMDAMNLWSSMGNTIAGWKKDDGSYYTLFIENGQVAGYVKAIPGQGFKWDYPESLMKERQRELDVAHEEDKLEG